MTKKNKEYKILKKIYNSKRIAITDYEKPDFIIEADNTKFGVEVTEFYLNESVARLINYKGYKEKILNSNDNKVLDKRDIGVLSRHELYVLDKVDNQYKFLFDFVAVKYDDGLNFHSKPTYELVENKIIDIINIKNNKANDYEKHDYTELIIQGMESISEEYIKKLLVSQKILDMVDNSFFKRVYLLIGKYLIVYGENPNENIELYNVSGDANE